MINEIAKVPTDLNEKPRIPVHIFDCGQVGHEGESDVDADLSDMESEDVKPKNAL